MAPEFTLTAEAADPWCLRAGEAGALLSGHPWRRFVVLGDSVAEGLTEPVDGFHPLPFADRVRVELAARAPELAYLNLGRRNLRAAAVRATQLDAALAFRPDLALLVCGANDAMRPGYESRAAAVDAELTAIIRALRRAGALVVTMAVFVMPAYPMMPAWLGPAFARRMRLLARRQAALAGALRTLHVDLSDHPAIAAPGVLTARDGLHGNGRSHAIAAAETIRRLSDHLQGASMPLDPQLQAMRDQRQRDDVAPLYTMSLADARAADLASIQATGGTPEPVHEVLDTTFTGPGGALPLRVYRPSGARPLPVLVYLFGGGWVLGTVDTADGIGRALANAAGCLVVVPGYRLAPEHPFPAAVHDCNAAVRWVAEHAAALGADPTRIAVGGDSAGGNLTAATTLLARDVGGPDLVGQVLVYPNTDQLADDDSLRDNADPWLFNRHSVAWYGTHYLTDPADAADPLASPLRADTLKGLPPALVITAEFDPLRDQGERYAHRLTDDGVPTELTRYPGMAHGFFAMAGTVDAGRTAIEQVAATLRGWFNRSV